MVAEYTLFEWMAEHDKLVVAKIYFFFANIIGSFNYYVLHRGVCWLIGCDEHRGRSGYLPEDCTEWWCDRCGAEGINHMVTTRETLEGVIPQLRFRISHIPGRIHQRICRHKDIGWRLFDERWGMPHPNPYMWGWCRKCNKGFNKQLEWFKEDEDG